VVLALRLMSGDSVLDGFTLRGAAIGGQGLRAWDGNLLTVRNCIIEDFDGSDRGAAGGIQCYRNPLSLYESTVRRCLGADAGGLRVHESDALVDGCSFEECDIGINANAITGTNSLIVRNSRFVRNTKVGLLKGQQIHTALIEDCWFEENRGDEGLNALIVGGPPAIVQRCVFVNNTSIGDPGAIKWQSSSGAIRNNTFVNNVALPPGNNGSTVEIFGIGNVEFAGNIIVGSEGGFALRVGTANVTDSCNVFWNNADGDAFGIELDPSSVFADPEFCNAEAGDFTVQSTSPCAPENTLGCGGIGAFGVGCGSVSVRDETWARIKGMYR
jgi:hypothetical protein